MAVELSAYNGKTVRITLETGEIFDGVSLYFDAEYMLAEYGREEDALQLDDWIFYQSEIADTALLPDGIPCFWGGRPLHLMRLAPVPSGMIKRGEKTVELRLNDEKRRKIRIGDVIRFESTADAEDVIYAEVRALYPFPSFDELYRALPLEKCGYTHETLPCASPRDMDAYYTPEEQQRHGVLGIEIALL